MRLSWKFGTVLLSALCLAASAFAEETPRQTTEVEDYVVTGTRTRHTLEDVPVETVVITREDIERMPSQNIVDVLKTVPGLNFSLLDDNIEADTVRATMRGLRFHDGHGLILIDGQRVRGDLGAHGAFGISLNQLPLSMVERIEIVKGAASSLYGSDALAGVVNIITRRVPKEASTALGASYGRYDVLDRQGVAAEKKTRDYYRASLAHGGPVFHTSGYFLHYGFEQDDGVRESPATTTRHSLMGKWHTDVTENLSINLNANYGHSRRDSNSPLVSYDREYDSYRFAGGLTYRLDSHEFNLKGYTYWQDYSRNAPGATHGYDTGKAGYDEAEALYSWYTDMNILTLGAASQRQHVDNRTRNYPQNAPETVSIVDKSVTTNSLFIQNETMLFDHKLTLVPGARLDDHSAFGTEINPKFSAMYRIFDATTLRGSVGRAFKAPNLRQLYQTQDYLHGSTFFRANPDLNPETAWSYSLNLEQGILDDLLTLNVGYFYTDLKDMIVRENTGQFTPQGDPIDTWANVEKGRIQGAEVSARLTLADSFFVNAGFNYTESENRSTGNDLPYVPKHTFSLAPTYIYQPLDLGLSLTLTHVGKQFRNAANTQEVGEHTVIDARVWKQFTEMFRVSLDAKNLTASDRGDGDYAHRIGRTFGINLELQF